MPNSYLRLGMITLIGVEDLNGDFSPARSVGYRPGQIFIGVDAFGPKIFNYIRNLSGSAFAQGDVVRKVAVLVVSNITSGTVTSATKVAAYTLGTVYVAAGIHPGGKHAGMMFHVDDNDDSAGAAPENEVSIVSSNTADVANLDIDFPMTAALAANDDISILTPGWHAEDAVAADLAQNVLGGIITVGGISDGNYGFVQQYGFQPDVKTLASMAAVTAGTGAIAAANTVDVEASGGIELQVGYFPFGVKTDTARDKAPLFWKLFSPYMNIATP